MSIRILLLVISCVAVFESSTRAQQLDIPPAQARVVLVDKIQAIVSSRGTKVEISDTLPNPFFAKAPEIKAVEVVEDLSVPLPGLSEAELVNELASKIPATGTLVFGGNSMLLLGSKKVKIGEKINIAQDGKDYELTLVAVNATTFSVKLGETTRTRPVRFK